MTGASGMRVYEGDLFVIRVSGADAIDLLHRVTSNDVKGLALGAENFQCLLTAKGRMIAPFRLKRDPDACLLKGPVELKKAVVEALDRYIFADKVTVEELPDEVGVVQDDSLRIERGEPRWGVDLDAETIPYEGNLAEYVSTSKGCYTGQEVMARIETYGQVQKRLVRLAAAASARPLPGGLKIDGHDAGRLTSVTARPSIDGKWRALGLIRREGWEPGTVLIGEDGVQWNVTN